MKIGQENWVDEFGGDRVTGIMEDEAVYVVQNHIRESLNTHQELNLIYG